MPTTVYDVSTRYGVTVSGAPQLAGLRTQADQTAGSLRSLAAVAASGVGFGLAKKYLVDANAEMEGLRSTMAQSIALNFQVPFQRGADAAQEMVDRFQQLAKASPGTTKDFAQMGNAILGPVVRAKGTLDDVVKLTQGAMLAKGPLVQWDEAARDIESALNGTLNARDRFARSVLEPRGLNAEKFNALSQDQRRAELLKALSDPAILAYGKAVEHTWAGASSTFIDNLSIGLQRVGLPLFKAMTGEVVGWNHWLDANEKTVETWAQKFSTGLMTGFTAVKDATAFVVAHYDELLTLAQAWTLAQGAGMVSNLGGAIAGGIKGAVGVAGRVGRAVGMRGAMAMESSLLEAAAGGTALATEAQVAGGALAGLVGPIGLAVAGLGAFAVALEAGRRVPGGVRDKEAELDAIRQALNVERANAVGEAETAGAIFDWAQKHGVLQTTGDEGIAARKLDEELIRLGMGDSTERNRLVDLAERIIDRMDPEEWDKRLGRVAFGPEAPTEAEKRRNLKPPSVNIKIDRVEVASDDPDRFVHQLTTAARRAQRNPTAARRALAGGF